MMDLSTTLSHAPKVVVVEKGLKLHFKLTSVCDCREVGFLRTHQHHLGEERPAPLRRAHTDNLTKMTQPVIPHYGTGVVQTLQPTQLNW